MSELIEKIKQRTIECGDCWEWQLCIRSSGPYSSYFGHSVRRTVYRETHGEIDSKLDVTCTCGNIKCVNPDHLKAKRRQAIHREKAKAGGYVNPARAAKISKARRAGTKIAPETVAAIRSGEMDRNQAIEVGVRQSYFYKIKRFEVWKDYVNPFTGLGAR